jgi:hypothetical protein
MKLSLDQPIAASAEEAQAAFADPAFYHSLGELQGISAPAVLSFSSSPKRASIVLGYRFAGQLNGPARRILDPAKLTWSQVSEVDIAARRTQVRMVPDNYAGIFSFAGWYELRPAGDMRCTQHLEVDLRVHLPLLGPLAERAIAAGVRHNLAETARLVERYLASGNGAPGRRRSAGADGVAGGRAPGAGGQGTTSGPPRSVGSETDVASP